jgi:hypothetical protein
MDDETDGVVLSLVKDTLPQCFASPPTLHAFIVGAAAYRCRWDVGPFSGCRLNSLGLPDERGPPHRVVEGNTLVTNFFSNVMVTLSGSRWVASRSTSLEDFIYGCTDHVIHSDLATCVVESVAPLLRSNLYASITNVSNGADASPIVVTLHGAWWHACVLTRKHLSTPADVDRARRLLDMMATVSRDVDGATGDVLAFGVRITVAQRILEYLLATHDLPPPTHLETPRDPDGHERIITLDGLQRHCVRLLVQHLSEAREKKPLFYIGNRQWYTTHDNAGNLRPNCSAEQLTRALLESGAFPVQLAGRSHGEKHPLESVSLLRVPRSAKECLTDETFGHRVLDHLANPKVNLAAEDDMGFGLQVRLVDALITRWIACDSYRTQLHNRAIDTL